MKRSAEDIGVLLMTSTEIDDKGDVDAKILLLEPHVRAECIQLAILRELRESRFCLEEILNKLNEDKSTQQDDTNESETNGQQ
jgi:hypothetical protein